MLRLNDLHVYYGNVHALKGIGLEISQGDIVALLGGNGAGKSTTLKAISRLIRPKQGAIHFEGQSILSKGASRIVKEGIVHCLEDRGIFPDFTVEENLHVGAYTRKDAEINADIEKVYHYFPRLQERRGQKGQTLSGGEAQMLAIGRSLMARPKLLLLDEPSLGIAPILVTEIFDMIQQLKAAGMTILLVEQNANLALEIADYAYVLENGKVALEGNAVDLKADQQIRRSYLGG